MGQQSKLRAEPSLEVDQRAIPLEPRVMLDANLTIDPLLLPSQNDGSELDKKVRERVRVDILNV